MLSRIRKNLIKKESVFIANEIYAEVLEPDTFQKENLDSFTENKSEIINNDQNNVVIEDLSELDDSLETGQLNLSELIVMNIDLNEDELNQSVNEEMIDNSNNNNEETLIKKYQKILPKQSFWA